MPVNNELECNVRPFICKSCGTTQSPFQGCVAAQDSNSATFELKSQKPYRLEQFALLNYVA